MSAEGLVGETANCIAEEVVEYLDGVSDNLDRLAERLKVSFKEAKNINAISENMVMTNRNQV
jgi:hypothetical protein